MGAHDVDDKEKTVRTTGIGYDHNHQSAGVQSPTFDDDDDSRHDTGSTISGNC